MVEGFALAIMSALSSAGLGGLADYLGGRLSRRFPTMLVVACSQGWSLVVLVACMFLGFGFQGWRWSAWGLVTGVLLVVGLGLFYLALAEGNMASVAPIATFGAVVPFLWGIRDGERPARIVLMALLVAVIGLVLSVYVGGRATRRQVLLSGCAAIVFGFTTVAMGRAYAESGTLGLVVSKIVIVVVASALVKRSKRSVVLRRRDQVRFFGLAACDAGGAILFGISLTAGYLSIAGVVASFYPAMTVLLAWWLEGERLGRLQMVGLVMLFGSIGVMVGV